MLERRLIRLGFCLCTENEAYVHPDGRAYSARQVELMARNAYNTDQARTKVRRRERRRGLPAQRRGGERSGTGGSARGHPRTVGKGPLPVIGGREVVR